MVPAQKNRQRQRTLLRRPAKSKYDQDDQSLVKIPMHSSDKYAFGPYRLDAKQNQLFCNNKAVRLPKLKFLLLRLLMDDRNEVVTYEVFWETVWGETYKPVDDLRDPRHKVNVHFDGIRRVLGEKYDKCIDCIRGIGYRFSDEVLNEIQAREGRGADHSQPPLVSPLGLACPEITEDLLARL